MRSFTSRFRFPYENYGLFMMAYEVKMVFKKVFDSAKYTTTYKKQYAISLTNYTRILRYLL